MEDLTPLLSAIDAAYRMAIRAGEKNVAKLLLMASLEMSQRIGAANRKAE